MQLNTLLQLYKQTIVILSFTVLSDISWNCVTSLWMLCNIKESVEQNVCKSEIVGTYDYYVLRRALRTVSYDDITSLYRIIGDISHFATIEWKLNFRRLESSHVFWEFETLSNIVNNLISMYLVSSRKWDEKWLIWENTAKCSACWTYACCIMFIFKFKFSSLKMYVLSLPYILGLDFITSCALFLKLLYLIYCIFLTIF